MTTATDTSPDYRTITERQQRAWEAGDVARVGSLAILHGELLCEALDIHPGERVLDVGAGNGAAALAAARRGADVTATDFVEHLLHSAERIAEIHGLRLRTHVADAQSLPFPDDSFDVVMSTFGAMFAPDQQRVADELVRVGRPDGRIGMCNWAPVSLSGDVLRIMDRHVPPPAGLRPAIQWGCEDRLRELFGERVRTLDITTRQLTFRYPSATHMLDHFRTWDGPTKVAFDSLDTERQARLAADLIEVYSTYNRADDGTLVAPSDYVEVVAVIR
jgi:SAM-dependent methyltransferase